MIKPADYYFTVLNTRPERTVIIVKKKFYDKFGYLDGNDDPKLEAFLEGHDIYRDQENCYISNDTGTNRVQVLKDKLSDLGFEYSGALYNFMQSVMGK